MRDIQLKAKKANREKLNDVLDNIGIAYRAMEMLTEINDTKAAKQKCERHCIGNA